MELTLSLMMECHVSIYDLSKALNFFETPLLKKRKVYEQFIDAFEEFRFNLKTTPFYDCGSESGTALAPSCPACPKDQNGKLFVSLDACFGLPRKKTSGMSYREPLSDNMFFHNQDKVDEFVSSYPVASGNSCSNKVQ
ncbi:uncharacterized protein LOC114530415 [Dendronephthya gigantea]|uniref:uncharacterized protein LOC114530415 n=1 Tax=Dendronephthya gigantea TaxID=151771 RepID=UPI0010690BA3|nr:uncharacterized protein LOC114530415 [Dendronephthya gigantea]